MRYLSINFDDEGTQAKRNVLIENGVLNGYMTDVLSAKQLGMERTGNGRRQSFRSIPIPRMTNTFIDQGESNPEDILSSTKKGIYVQSLSGGSINAAYLLSDKNSSRQFFVKTNRTGREAMFEAEGRGLEAMASSKTIRVPRAAARAARKTRDFLAAYVEESAAGHPTRAALASIPRSLGQQNVGVAQTPTPSGPSCSIATCGASPFSVGSASTTC